MTNRRGRSGTSKAWFLILVLAILIAVWLSIQDAGDDQGPEPTATVIESAPSSVPTLPATIAPDDRDTEPRSTPPSPTPILPTPYPMASPYPPAQPTSVLESYPPPDAPAPSPYPAPGQYP